jgi:hypothetical protein
MGDEPGERLAKLETNMGHVLEKLGDLTTDLEGIKSLIWKAVGGLSVLVVIMNLVVGKH